MEQNLIIGILTSESKSIAKSTTFSNTDALPGMVHLHMEAMALGSNDSSHGYAVDIQSATVASIPASQVDAPLENRSDIWSLRQTYVQYDNDNHAQRHGLRRPTSMSSCGNRKWTVGISQCLPTLCCS